MTKCPVCKIDTESKQERGIFFDYCNKCEGLLLERVMFERLQKSFDFKTDEKLTFAFEVLEDRLLDCPACNSEMVHGTIGEIVIDICPECIAIWFDQGEFEDIFQFDPKTGSYTMKETVFKYISRIIVPF